MIHIRVPLQRQLAVGPQRIRRQTLAQLGAVAVHGHDQRARCFVPRALEDIIDNIPRGLQVERLQDLERVRVGDEVEAVFATGRDQALCAAVCTRL